MKKQESLLSKKLKSLIPHLAKPLLAYTVYDTNKDSKQCSISQGSPQSHTSEFLVDGYRCIPSTSK